MIRRQTKATLAGSLILATTGLLACGGAEPEPGADAGTEAAGDPTTPAADARYLTHLLFAGADGRAFYASFDQTTETGYLARTYDAWWREGGGWARLLGARDTLPVPRAAWRILPAPEMRVRVGNAGQIIALAFRPAVEEDAPELVRLEAGEEVALWTGPTGQRESLGLAGLVTAEGLAPGVLFFRRAARGLRFTSPSESTLAFILSDEDGNGLLILQAGPGEPAVARTWLHGTEAVWSDVMLQPVDSVGAPPAADREPSDDPPPAVEWAFDIPDTDLSGTIRASAEAPASGAPARTVECSLVSGGETFRFVGLVAEVPPP